LANRINFRVSANNGGGGGARAQTRYLLENKGKTVLKLYKYGCLLIKKEQQK